jgi:hypothetical protein
MKITRFDELGLDAPVYILKTDVEAPAVIKCFLISAENDREYDRFTIKVGFFDGKVGYFKVRGSDKYTILRNELKGIVFPSLRNLEEYVNKVKSAVDSIKRGWLLASEHTPSTMQRVEVTPEGFEYVERAYYLNGEYIKEGYRKKLNKIAHYWRPLD